MSISANTGEAQNAELRLILFMNSKPLKNI